MILTLKDVNTYYGTSHVLQDISLDVDTAEVVALLGRNGVGKTTTLRSIMGLTPPKSGSIVFNGQEVQGRPPYALASLGIAYMPDDLRIFPDLTCEENLEIAARVAKRSGYWNKSRVHELFPVLNTRRKQKGLNMSGGEKKMLSLGRALMANPDLVLLDEPSEGLAPLIVRMLADVINTIRGHEVTVLLADQNLRFCRRVCDRGHIIEKGRMVHSDTMEGIMSTERVVKEYLAL
ncbi:MAG: ABC transporter ATP-binding protein [Desulfomonilaceae bacterium]|nr:ABC transporter ATP-binding protein [Desulfomonilaceae bacterium]